MTTPEFVVETLNDRAVLVRFHADPSARLTSLLTALATAASGLEGVLDTCPGMTTVLIETPGRPELQADITGLIETVEPAEGTLHEVTVTYDGEDFEWVCSHLGMAADAVIHLHSAGVYDVRLLGSPGFVYLSDVPPDLAVPRLDAPRRSVAAGSVGIAGRQTGIYGMARPGGWRIIARAAEVPAMVPGDRVRFVPR